MRRGDETDVDLHGLAGPVVHKNAAREAEELELQLLGQIFDIAEINRPVLRGLDQARKTVLSG